MSLRVVGLNIGGLRPNKTYIDGKTKPTQAAIDSEYVSFLRAQDARSKAVGARTAFALQEVSIDCVYLENSDNEDQFQEALDALGRGYAGNRSLDPCSPAYVNPYGPVRNPYGYMAKAVLTDGIVMNSASIDLRHEGGCHRTSAHAMKIRVSRELTVWVASIHFSLIPWVALEQFEWVMNWLRVVAKEDWDRHPILIVGDFNIAAYGVDRRYPLGWDDVVCKGKRGKEAAVPSDDHREAFTDLVSQASKSGFEQVLGLNVTANVWPGTTFKPWSRMRKIDNAFIRNAPCANCVFAHLTPPEGDTPFYFTDHMGYVVSILTPKQAARRKARQHFLLQ